MRTVLRLCRAALVVAGLLGLSLAEAADSDGLRARFPRYNYNDTVLAQYRLVTPGLDRIRAAVLAINSADDERNPPELGIIERELPRIKGARLHLIPGSEETRAHGTTGMARFYKDKAQLAEFLASVPRR